MQCKIKTKVISFLILRNCILSINSASLVSHSVRYNGRRRQSMSLEMVPEPRLDSLQPSCGLLAQRRVKSYEDAVGEPPDYDRNSITQFIWAPFSTKPNVDELRRTTSAAMATASLASAGRSHPTFSRDRRQTDRQTTSDVQLQRHGQL